MGHHLIGARSVVEQNVRTFQAPSRGRALLSENTVCDCEQVLDCRFRKLRNLHRVFPGNDQHMAWAQGMDIHKGKAGVIPVHYGGRQPPFQNSAENAVVHRCLL